MFWALTISFAGIGAVLVCVLGSLVFGAARSSCAAFSVVRHGIKGSAD